MKVPMYYYTNPILFSSHQEPHIISIIYPSSKMKQSKSPTSKNSPDEVYNKKTCSAKQLTTEETALFCYISLLSGECQFGCFV